MWLWKISIPIIQKSFFQRLISKIKFKDLDKHKIAEEIINDSGFNFLYWIQLVTSSAIATLGLLINSSPVVIWAMLISPLLMPIKVFAFSITTWNKYMYFRSLRTLVSSIILSIIVAYIISFVVPFAHLTSEIIARASPTIIDLFIAFASGLIAFMSLWFTRLSETIAWVAMAAAILPPLSVIWIALQFQNMGIAQWSWFLFLANLIAILVVWVLVLYFFWFTPGNKWGKTRSLTSIILVVLTTILISIPLIKSMKSISEDININQNIKNTIHWFTKNNIDKKIEIDNIKFTNIDKNKILISANLNVPIWTLVTDNHKKELTNLLALSTKKSIDLDLRLIDISSVYIDVVKEPTREEKIKFYMQNFFQKHYPEIVLIDIKIAYQKNPIVLLQMFSLKNINEQDLLQSLESRTKADLDEDVVFIFQRQKNQQKVQVPFLKEQSIITQEFNKIFSWSRIERLNISSIDFTWSQNLLSNTIQIEDIYITEDIHIFEVDIFFQTSIKENIAILAEQLKQNIEQVLQKKIKLNLEYKIFSNINL